MFYVCESIKFDILVYIPLGLIILQGNCAVPPILTLTFMIGGGLSIAASELSLSTGGGNGLLTMGIPVSTKIQHHKIKPF